MPSPVADKEDVVHSTLVEEEGTAILSFTEDGEEDGVAAELEDGEVDGVVDVELEDGGEDGAELEDGEMVEDQEGVPSFPDMVGNVGNQVRVRVRQMGQDQNPWILSRRQDPLRKIAGCS